MSKTVTEDKISKALDALKSVAGEDIAKSVGVKDSGAMKGESGSPQIHHTSSNSERKEFAGSSWQEVSGNGTSADIAENGTDYGSALAKSILELISKGKLSAEEGFSLLEKGGFPFGKKDGDKDEDKDDEKKDKKDKVEKSFADLAAENATLSDAFEVSDVLRELGNTIAKSIEGLKAHVDARLAATTNKTEGFQKSLATAISDLGEALVVTSQRVEDVESAPARAPKSQNVGVLEKSFGGDNQALQLSHRQICAGLEDMVVKGLVHPQAVIKFESTKDISSELLGRVSAHLAGK